MIKLSNQIGNILDGGYYSGQYINRQQTSAQRTAKSASDTITDLLDWFGLGTNRRQQEYNSAEAIQQRNYESEMSNTAYQRAVQDMEQAGLNPVLAMSAGQASTPSGASASGGGGSNQLGALANLLATTSAHKLKSKELQLAKAKLNQDTTIQRISPYNGKPIKITKIIKH